MFYYVDRFDRPVEVKDVDMTTYQLITDAAQEPLTLSEVKDFCRLGSNTDFDTQLTDLITTARTMGERITGRDFITKTYKGYLDCFPYLDYQGIRIQKCKVQSITSFNYYVDDSLQTIDASTYYLIETKDYPSIYLKDGQTYPTDGDVRRQAIEITFIAGYGTDPEDVPEPLKRAMLAHINLLLRDLGDCEDSVAFNKQVKQLYHSYIVGSRFFHVV